MAEWLYVIVLGILEGITEFLPISSTGHLIVATQFLPIRDSLTGTFEIFIQLGAVLAVLAHYRTELWHQFRTVQSNDNTQQLWLGIVIAFLPSAMLGLLFEESIAAWLFRPTVVAIALISGGLMFIGVERYVTATPDDESSVDDRPLTMQQALIVGVWQVLALIPVCRALVCRLLVG
ncbi:MAG: undecaprenyl-diphosphate phosphatase [Anaerolineae bacterium]|nr:undecaprenyl-diphosphate phosphatase [Anaerolineae bacterium]